MQPSPTGVAEPSSRISLIEILGYLGIAGGLYGTFLVLSLLQPSQSTIGLVALALTVVFLLAGAAIGTDAPDRLSRLRSVCWYLSVQSFSSMLQAWMTSPTSLLGGFSSMFPVFLLTALYALGLWLFLGRLLQQLAFYGAALSALVVLVAPGPASFVFGGPDLTGVALVFWLGGAVWFVLGYVARIRPPRAAMVLGVLTSILGPFLFAPDSEEAAFLLVLATSVAFLYFGGEIADRAVTGIAAIGAVVGLVGFLVAIGVDDEASGGARVGAGGGAVRHRRLGREAARRPAAEPRSADVADRPEGGRGRGRAPRPGRASAPADAGCRTAGAAPAGALGAEGAFDLPGRFQHRRGVALRAQAEAGGRAGYRHGSEQRSVRPEDRGAHGGDAGRSLGDALGPSAAAHHPDLLRQPVTAFRCLLQERLVALRAPRQEDLSGRTLFERQRGPDVHDRPQLALGLGRVDADPSIAVADVELCALTRGSGEPLERRMRQLPQRQLLHRGGRQGEQARPEHVAGSAHVREEAMVLEAEDQPVGGRTREVGGLDDVRERPGSRLDGGEDRSAAVQHADAAARRVAADLPAARGPARVHELAVAHGRLAPRSLSVSRRTAGGCCHAVPIYGTEFHYAEQLGAAAAPARPP